MLIERMNKKLAHRGPDDEGAFVDDNVALGHRRLSIIDLSPAGHQPMSYGRLVITYNGELYNFRELKSHLQKLDRSLVFKTHTDTEVILAAYKQWGMSCLDRFNGM